MKILLAYVLLEAIIVVCATQKVSYDGFKVYKIVPRNSIQLKALQSLENNFEYNFWSPASALGNPAHVMVSPHMAHNFTTFLKLHKLNSEVYIENVQGQIDDEQSKISLRSVFGWTSYHRLDDIYSWLKQLALKHSDILTLVEGGSSYEGRKILGVKLSYSASNVKKGVFLEGGIHAREWISPATVTYILNQLLYSTNPNVREIAKNNDWYIFPNLNPDGYEYTHRSDRLWRKTRTRYGSCYGADPNRNWGFHWMEGGASNNPCSETYAGPKKFSENETRTMSQYISTIAGNLHAYIAFHSYSQLLLLPYGYTNAHLENYDEMMRIGLKAKASIARRYGTIYKVGNLVDILYVASGGSMDWVKGTYHTPYTYTYELRDTGRYGFLLPAEQIIPTGEETLDSLVTVLQEVAKAKAL